MIQTVRSIQPNLGEPITPNQLCAHEPTASKNPTTDTAIPIIFSLSYIDIETSLALLSFPIVKPRRLYNELKCEVCDDDHYESVSETGRNISFS